MSRDLPPSDAVTGLLHEHTDVHSRRWFTLTVMCLGVVLVVMALSGLNVALPTIQRDLETTGTELLWILDSYAIVFAGLLLVGGAMGDKWGRKGALQLGLSGFGIGAVIAAVADTPVAVIAGRSVMGAGAALIMPATLSIITAVFPPEERTRAIAIWAGWAAAGGAVGPVITGLVIEGWAIVPAWGWEASFLINVPVVAVVLVAVTLFTPKSRESTPRPLDPFGGVLSVAAIAVLLFAIIQGPDTGWRSGPIVGSFAAAAALLAAFVVWERVCAHPMLPMQLFRRRLFSTGTTAIGLSFAITIGFFLLQALYLQQVLGYDALETGLAIVPMALATVVVAPPTAVWTERFGLGSVVGGGFVVMAAGLLLLATVSTSTPLAVLIVGFVIIGVGMALTTAPATGAIMTSVPLDKAGVGSAMNDGATELGGAIGVAVFGSVIATIYRSRIDVSGLDLSSSEIEDATESLGAAANVAADLEEPISTLLLIEARAVFVDAFAVTMVIGAAASVVGGIGLWWMLRAGRSGPIGQ